MAPACWCTGALAPTEWNFHPRALRPGAPRSGRTAACAAACPRGGRAGGGIRSLRGLRAGPNAYRAEEVSVHELSLAGGILQVVEDAAAREAFARVLQLRLEVGKLAGVELQALRFALEAIAPGTLLEGAEVLIDEPPGRAWCMGCSTAVEIGQRGDACPPAAGTGSRPRAVTSCVWWICRWPRKEKTYVCRVGCNSKGGSARPSNACSGRRGGRCAHRDPALWRGRGAGVGAGAERIARHPHRTGRAGRQQPGGAAEPGAFPCPWRACAQPRVQPRLGQDHTAVRHHTCHAAAAPSCRWP
jgi:hydrogenase nickel incorporation protein HypA/HybF